MIAAQIDPRVFLLKVDNLWMVSDFLWLWVVSGRIYSRQGVPHDGSWRHVFWHCDSRRTQFDILHHDWQNSCQVIQSLSHLGHATKSWPLKSDVSWSSCTVPPFGPRNRVPDPPLWFSRANQSVCCCPCWRQTKDIQQWKCLTRKWFLFSCWNLVLSAEIQHIVELRTPAMPVGVGGGKERGGFHLNLRTWHAASCIFVVVVVVVASGPPSRSCSCSCCRCRCPCCRPCRHCRRCRRWPCCRRLGRRQRRRRRCCYCCYSCCCLVLWSLSLLSL